MQMRATKIGMVAMAALAAAVVWAGEGIPVGNAIFYPSVEAVYTHTDNLFLQDSSMPLGEVSDSFWLVRPTLGIEFPFRESYVRLDFGYQYKDYQDFNLSSHNAYNFDLKSNFGFADGGKFTLNNHFIRGVQEVNEFDPGYERVFGNVPFYRDELQMGYDRPVSALDTVGLFARYNTVHFNNDNVLRPFYNYDQLGGGLRWKRALSPASAWVTSVEYLTNDPNEKPQDLYLYTTLDKKYDQWTLLTGWEGNHKETFSGFAKFGWSRMNFKDNDFSEFSGLVADLGLGWQPAEAFKVDLLLSRHAYQSTYNVNNYYTANQGRLQLQQQVSRYFFWTAGYLYQENAYPDTVKADVFGPGGPILAEFLLTQGQDRKDKISRLYGELGFHLTRQFSLRANYQYENRDSNIRYFDGFGIRKPYSYKENRVVLQAMLGW
jgi:hypothetical protein